MASKLHRHTKKVLRELYPICPIQEEYSIKVGSTTLFIDLFVGYPYNIAVECQGRQHNEYVPFFHRTEHGFLQYKQRDRQKEEWCRQNSIPLVYVYEGDNITPEYLLDLISEAQARKEC